MKNYAILLLLVFFTLGGTLNAQQREMKPGLDKSAMMDRMKEKLSLTDQQVLKIKAIDAKYQNQEQELKAKMKYLKQEYTALRNKKKAEIDVVFTPEQRTKIKDWKKNARKDKSRQKSKKGYKDGQMNKNLKQKQLSK